MDLSIVFDNLLSPPILFFVVGLTAAAVRSDLEMPQPLPKIMSLFLLLAIGFKGGAQLRAGGLDLQIVLTLGSAMLMAFAVPIWTYAIVRRRLDPANAAAVAATYGSISAVTFITAAAMLQKLGVSYGGHMVAAMALMESPAIVIAVLLARRAGAGVEGAIRWGKLLHEAFLNGPVFLLMGALVVGGIASQTATRDVMPITEQLFKIVLVLFLLDMGIVAGRQMKALKRAGAFLGAFSIVAPVTHALIGIGLAGLIGLSPGNAMLLAVLCGSASYIAVPAAMRLAIPQASPGLYVPMALAMTFPFNIVIGLPLYWSIIRFFWS